MEHFHWSKTYHPTGINTLVDTPARFASKPRPGIKLQARSPASFMDVFVIQIQNILYSYYYHLIIITN